MASLPHEGRLYRLVSEDPVTFSDHIQISIIDALNTTAYYSMIAAQGAVSKKAWRGVVKNAPTPMTRPGQKPPEKNIQHIRAVDGLAAVQAWKRNAISQAKIANL